jgi:hypothetical protein
MHRVRRSRNPWSGPRRRGIKGRAGFRWGVAKLVKAPDFDSGIRGFESFLPSHFRDRDGQTVGMTACRFAVRSVVDAATTRLVRC